jgi:ribosomal-protein-alanine N-acetyltransferase
MTQDITVRQMEEKDIDSLVIIEEECFSLPWSKKAFQESYVKDYAYFFVAEIDKEIVGYVGLYKMGNDGDITNIGISSLHRRKGIGYKLMSSVLDFAKRENMELITLEVRESNIPAIALYEKLGFVKVGIRKDFYEKPVENAIIYQYIF